MAGTISYIPISIPQLGGAENIPLDNGVEYYYLKTATGLLTAPYAVAPLLTPDEGMRLVFIYDGGMTIGANLFYVFGYVFTAQEALAKCIIESIYIDGNWVTKMITTATWDDVGNILGDNIIDETIDGSLKLEQYSTNYDRIQQAAGGQGMSFRSGPGGTMEEFDAKTVGNFLYGNGSDVVSGPMGGQASIDGLGNLTINLNTITPDQLAFVPTSYFIAQLEILAADVILLNSAPQIIVANPGPTQYIKAVAGSAQIIFGASPYTTNVVLELVTDGSDVAQLENYTCLESTVSRITEFETPTTPPTAGQTQTEVNQGLAVRVKTGDPVAGDSVIKITVIYAIIDL